MPLPRQPRKHHTQSCWVWQKKTPTPKPWDNSEMSHPKSQRVLKTLVNSEKSGKISPVLKALGPPLKVSRSSPVSQVNLSGTWESKAFRIPWLLSRDALASYPICPETRNMKTRRLLCQPHSEEASKWI